MVPVMRVLQLSNVNADSNKSSEKLYISRTDLLQRKRELSLEKLELNVPVVPREKLQISSFLLASGGQGLIKKESFEEPM